jgi:hypothetical protein
MPVIGSFSWPPKCKSRTQGRAHARFALVVERGVCNPMLWKVIVEYLFKLDVQKTESELDKWFEQLREHGRTLGVEVEPLTLCERICLEHDARWMRLS